MNKRTTLKKLMSVVLCLVMLVSLAGCKSSKTETKTENKTATESTADTKQSQVNTEAKSEVKTGAEAEAKTEAAAETEGDTKTEKSEEAKPEEKEPAVSAQTVYPITVKDMVGREVTIEKAPEKIVSGYYISSSACIALGLMDKIVAIEQGAKKRPIYSLAAKSLIDIPNVGTAKAFDLETCLACEPELVILPKKQKDTAETLTQMGIPAIVVNPESHEQMLEMIALIGTAANANENAKKLSDYYVNKLDKVSELVSKSTQRPVVYIGGTGSYLTTAGKDMYQSGLIEATGATPAGADIDGSSWTEISYEQLLLMDPDIIVIPTNSNANGAPDYSVSDILADAQLQELKAVKSGKVYQMTYGFEAWDSPAPSGILGTMWMLKTVHPEIFSSEDFIKEVQDFYATFYGFTPDAESIN